MNKKAISPLIATVLIIGFTIVLAAVVLQWAGGFVKNLTAEQEKTVNLQTACMGMNLEITSAKLTNPTVNTVTTGTLTVKVANNNAEKELAGAIVLIETATERITGDADTTNANTIPILGSKDIIIPTTISWNSATTPAIQQINITSAIKPIIVGNKIFVVPKVKIGTDTKPCDIGVAATATIE
ncbi:MAG: type IV pilin [Candidatus Nanoarchaeia archaeon]|nr:type IV pilin [Candidatus Nanoarchaeia archaeon]MDD5587556.1 type IV pilin [Candidatus Nanoarchaeia archaeon]